MLKCVAPFLMIMTAALISPAHAEPNEPKLIWSCEGESDPNWASIDVFETELGKTIAIVAQVSDNGNLFEEDVIELEPLYGNQNGTITYGQVKNSQPDFADAVKNPSRKTLNAELSFNPLQTDLFGNLLGDSGPTGAALTESQLICTPGE